MKEKDVKRMRVIEARGKMCTVKYLEERRGRDNLFNGKWKQVELSPKCSLEFRRKEKDGRYQIKGKGKKLMWTA